MRRYTTGALWFIAAVAAVAVSISWEAYLLGGSEMAWGALISLSLLTAAAHLYPIRAAREGAVYVVSNVFLFAGTILLSPLELAAMGLVALLPLTWHQRRRPGALIRFTFNAGQSILSAQVAWMVIRLSGSHSLEGWESVGWIMAASLVFTAVQTACVGMIIALNSRIPLRRVEQINLRIFAADALMPLLGALVALVWLLRPPMLLLFVPPVVMIYLFMRTVHLVRAADLDSKTGLYNYPYFTQALAQELGRAKLVRRPLAVMFVDMDHLREINNNYGHLAGDMAIKHVTQVLQQELPATATLARFGGEEFVVLLPGCHPDEAEFVAWRLCRATSRQPMEMADGKSTTITVSIGVACAAAQAATPEELIHQADLAVFRAKALGRDRVVRADALTAEQLTLPGLKQAARVPAPSVTAVPAKAESLGSHAPAPAPPPEQTQATPAAAHCDDRTTRLVVAAMSVMALACLAWTGLGMGAVRYDDLLLVIPAALAAELLAIRIQVARGAFISITPLVSVVVGSGLLLGIPAAVLGGLTGALFHIVRLRQRSITKLAFNLSTSVVSAFMAGAVIHSSPHLEGGPLLLADLVVPLAAAAVHFLTGHSFLAYVLSRSLRRPYLLTWRQHLPQLAPQYAAVGAMGAYTVLGYRYMGIPGAAMFALPLMVLFLTFRVLFRRSNDDITTLEHAREKLMGAQRLEKQTLDRVLATLAAVADARDASVMGHSQQVAKYAEAIARVMGLSAADADRVRLAGLLHDLGKIGIPEAILHKPSRLSPEEYAVMKEHAAIGERLLADIPQLEDVSTMVGEHHEHYSGRGYPRGKKGAEITLGGRILAVADALDTILSDRPYSRSKPLEWALGELERCSGEQFDPRVVEALQVLVRQKESAFFVNSTAPDAGRGWTMAQRGHYLA